MLTPACRVILASASPRRKELLRRLLDDFEVIPADVDETPPPAFAPNEAAQWLAWQKAKLISEAQPDALIIGSDTIVAVSQQGEPVSLGKPADRKDAGRMLRILSARTHSVFTGVALLRDKAHDQFVVETTVTFRQISNPEIEAYIATGEPMDKAGAYAIQGGAACFVQDLEGSLSNVVGLPMQELERRLKRFLG